MRHKHESYSRFCEFKALTELQSDHHIKVVRTDGGSKYGSYEFEGYLSNSGIIHEKTASHTPKQNGLAEVINRIIIKYLQCMLFDANLSAGFWAETALTAMYLTNHSSVSRLPDMTPEQAWSGLKPQVTEFRPFSCPAYSHIPKANHTKLESKTQKCVLVGYQVGTKAYCLWDPKAHKMVISRDVIFNEWLKPPGQPEEPIDLSKIIWNSELEYKNIENIS